MIPLGRGPRTLEQAREPAELLVACHGRIRHFSEVAVRLARGGHAPTDRIAEAARSLEQYFSIALPLHERDEEDSLAPRLLESRAKSEVEEALARMTEEHRVIDELVDRAMPLWRRVAAAPADVARVAGELEELAHALTDSFGPHLALEEHVIFPALEMALSPGARAAILQEIRARRTPEVRATMAALAH